MIKADHYGQWSHIYASFCMCSLTRATEALAFAEPNSNFPPSRFWSYVHPPKKPIRSADASAKLRVRRAHPGSFRHPHLDSTHRLAIKRGIKESSCSSIRSELLRGPPVSFFSSSFLPSTPPNYQAQINHAATNAGGRGGHRHRRRGPRWPRDGSRVTQASTLLATPLHNSAI